MRRGEKGDITPHHNTLHPTTHITAYTHLRQQPLSLFSTSRPELRHHLRHRARERKVNTIKVFL
jgi:hypothetical protein